MSNFYELSPEELEFKCILSDYEFKTSDELEELDGIIGQERAKTSLELGLRMKSNGYNIYAAGMTGTGKTTFVKKWAQICAKDGKIPDDVCYVYNFEEPRFPISLMFPAGKGKEFRDDMNELSETFKTEIPKVFSDEDFEKQKNEVMRKYQNERDGLIEEMEETASEYDFGVKFTNSGIYFMPKVEGNTISEEDYDNLTEDEKKKISKESDLLQEKASEIMRKIKAIEKKTRKTIEDLEYKIGLIAIGAHISKLKEKYKDFEDAIKYLGNVAEDALNNIYDFIDKDEEDEESLSSLLPLLGKKSEEDNIYKYKANLFIDNSTLTGSPVIIAHHPTYYNLVGEIEYDNEFGSLITDFMKIKPGLLHKANGGYLILQAQDILSNENSWEALKRAIKTKEATIESFRDHITVAAYTIKPKSIPLNVKVILVGGAYYYEILKEYDDEFCKYFKVYAEFDYEMPFNDANVLRTASFIKQYVKNSGSPPFSKDAVLEVIRYCMRLAERQDKLTSQFGKISELLDESVYYASSENLELVRDRHVLKAIDEKRFRHSLLEEKLSEMIEDNTVLIDNESSKIGQINALAVIDTSSYAFAKPMRITATTYMGMAGIINIEKEAEMSGSIHEKGVQVLSGYLGQTYAQNFPLTISARICFEQNYSEIDGDSASCAELYALISSLAEVPIKQEIAITGSVNQMGEVQAVGGVTYKVEGFYDLCKSRGLTGDQGVVIPMSCIKDLVLKSEIIESVADGMFHIYPITSVDDGIEILMGMPAGKKQNKGYTKNSVHGLVYKKLRDFHNKSLYEPKK